jgi:hypothetical protein
MRALFRIVGGSIFAAIMLAWGVAKFVLDQLGGADVMKGIWGGDGIVSTGLNWLFSTPWWVPSLIPFGVLGVWVWYALRLERSRFRSPDTVEAIAKTRSPDPDIPRYDSAGVIIAGMAEPLDPAPQTEPESSLGDFSPVRYGLVHRDPGERWGGGANHRYIEISVRFTFRSNVNNPQIRVTMIQRSAKVDEFNPRLLEDYIWYQDVDPRTHHASDRINIPIAFIDYDDQHPGYCGDFSPPPKVRKSYQYLFTVEVIVGDECRSVRLYINVPLPQYDLDPMDIHSYVGSLFYLLDERYSPFADGRFNLSLKETQAPPESQSAVAVIGPHGCKLAAGEGGGLTPKVRTGI